MGKKKKKTPGNIIPQTHGKSVESVEPIAASKNTNFDPKTRELHIQSGVSVTSMDPLNDLISSPLVHSSDGMIPVELHNTILTYHHSLELPIPRTRIESLGSN